MSPIARKGHRGPDDSQEDEKEWLSAKGVCEFCVNGHGNGLGQQVNGE